MNIPIVNSAKTTQSRGESIDSLHDPQAVEALRKSLKLDPQVIRRFRTALLKHGKADAAALDELPADEARQLFATGLQLHALQLHQRCDSQQDGASKLLFRTAKGMLIESVILRIATGRTTLCLSSQVGCAAACDFCATGKMGIAQNLSPAEILDQLVQTKQTLAAENRTIRNLVFMGMGEPLHNEENLFSVLAALASPEQFHHSLGCVLVSTVGIPDGMRRCAERFPKVNLALSLHSAVQAKREAIIPLAKKHPLDEIRMALVEINRLQTNQTPVMIEYLMLAGVNDSPADAARLIDWLAGLRVHVNLIPYNEVADAPHLLGSPANVQQEFSQRLKAAGLPTTIRYSLGADVAAACGQLVQKENREIAKQFQEIDRA